MKFQSVLFLLLLLVLIPACSNSPSEPNTPPVVESSLDCTAPTLAASSAQAFDRVEVLGIDGIDDAVYATYRGTAGTDGLTAVLVDEEGRAWLVVPPNPNDLLNGGTLQFAVTDGVKSCASLDLDVLPLDAATEDEIAIAVAAAEDMAEAFYDHMGLDPDVLRATTLDNLPPHVVPIALLLEALDGFDSPTSLAAMTPDQAAFAQALFAKIDIAESFAEIAATTRALPPLVNNLNSARDAARSISKMDCGDLGTVSPTAFDLTDPEDLRDYMLAARSAEESLGVLNDNIADMGTAFAILGLVAPEVGLVTGLLSFAGSLIQNMRANLYPNSITRLEYQVDKIAIEEDWDPGRGDAEIKWRFAKVWATNNGMGLARVGIDFITTIGAIPSGFSSALGNAAVGGLDIAVKEALNRRLDELGRDPDGDAECWGVGVTEFGPVVIPEMSEAGWVAGQVTAGEAISLAGIDSRQIIPEKIGSSTLRVRTVGGAFPGPFGFADRQIEVLRKEVVWLPSVMLVDPPGETETAQFRIDNALHKGPEDALLIVGPEVEIISTSYSGEVHTVEFKTPPLRTQYPSYIDAQSTSKELPPPVPERKGRLDIFSNESVSISPREKCLGNNEPLQLAATVVGADVLEVRWEIISGVGTLSEATGDTTVYRAPASGNGEVTIRGSLVQDPEIKDEITLTYGQCSGLVVYENLSNAIGFPFASSGECGNVDLDHEFSTDEIVGDPFDPLVLPDPLRVFVGRSESYSNVFDESGSFGATPLGSEVCSSALFFARSGFDMTLTGSADGTRLDFEMDCFAESHCEDLGEGLGVQCSYAVGSAGFIARWDFTITEATQYDFEMSLTCKTGLPEAFPIAGETISILVFQVRPDGSFTNFISPNQVLYGREDTIIDVSEVWDFVAPLAGQTDRAVILATFPNTSIGVFPNGIVETVLSDGFAEGFISVKKVTP